MFFLCSCCPHRSKTQTYFWVLCFSAGAGRPKKYLYFFRLRAKSPGGKITSKSEKIELPMPPGGARLPGERVGERVGRGCLGNAWGLVGPSGPCHAWALAGGHVFCPPPPFPPFRPSPRPSPRGRLGSPRGGLPPTVPPPSPTPSPQDTSALGKTQGKEILMGSAMGPCGLQ